MEEPSFAELLAMRQQSGKRARQSQPEQAEADDPPAPSSKRHRPAEAPEPGLSKRHRPAEATEAEHSTARASFHRENKNRPTETTAKRPVARHRDVLQTGSGLQRDPRFEEACGKLDATAFDKRYGFVYDELIPAETEQLKGKLKKAKQQEQVQALRSQIKDLERAVAKQKQQRAAEQQGAQEKAQEREAVKQGKKPFYLKASEKRRLALVQKFKTLKASGGLEKALAKRRQKVASKDHRLLPRGRRQRG